ncbi:hypothetical protein DPMN_162727 [Dreissena polymorpha]|uniref:CCHC-type domain-containing protein n=1 Tax=Dreissena polymorpha TaxID=45954 RepID=A0A9D4EVG6_DREPO|nr:hypothetical protein DPMN_162727 [Dreissena polymorpha]
MAMGVERQQFFRPYPATCFACGRQGHFRRECEWVNRFHGNIVPRRETGNTDRKLSYDKYIAGLDISDIDAHCEEKYQLSHSSTVKGRLKRHVRFWKSIGANPDIIDGIVGGYKLPLIELP